MGLVRGFAVLLAGWLALGGNGGAAPAAGSGVTVQARDLGDEVSHMALSEDGRALVVAQQRTGRVLILDTDTGRVVHTAESPGAAFVLVRGTKAYVLGRDQGVINVFAFDDRTCEQVDQLLAGSKSVMMLTAPRGAAFQGLILGVETPVEKDSVGDRRVFLIDEKKDNPRLVRSESSLRAVTWSADGKTVIEQGKGSGDSRSESVGRMNADAYLQLTPRPDKGTASSQEMREWTARQPPFERGEYTDPELPLWEPMLVADQTTDYLYSVDGTQIRAMRTNGDRMTTISRMGDVTFAPPGYWESLAAECRPVAATVDDRTHIYLPSPRKDGLVQVTMTAFGGSPSTQPLPGTDIGGTASARVRAEINQFPEQVMAGESISFPLYTQPLEGKFEAIQGPPGITVSADGVLSWTPDKARPGVQQIKIRAMVNGELSFLRLTTTVAVANAPAAAHRATTAAADKSREKNGSGSTDIVFSIAPAPGLQSAPARGAEPPLTLSVEPSEVSSPRAVQTRTPQAGAISISSANGTEGASTRAARTGRSDRQYAGAGQEHSRDGVIDLVIESPTGSGSGSREGLLAAALKGSPANGVLTAEEIGQQCSDAVVVLEGRESSGSGFFITTDGYILTCAHVLPSDGHELAVRYRYRGEQETTYRVKLVGLDRKQDLALLKIDPAGPIATVRLDLESPPAMGEAVSIIGNPGLGRTILEYTMTQGIVSNPRRELEETAFVQTSASVNPGSSGSPAINSRGGAFGVVVAKATVAEGVGFVVAPDRVAEFLHRCLRP